MRTIYLDFSSTTPVAASVRERMLPFLNEFFGDPISEHWMGRAAREAIEDARGDLASLIGCHPSEVVFTSGGTESVNLALLGLSKCIVNGTGSHSPHLIISSLEHACVRQCAARLGELGWEISRVDCDQQGIVQPQAFEAAIRPNTRLASIIHGSHRIGTIQPLRKIARICHERDILLHSDAAQSVGKVPINVEQMGVDLLSLSGHKFYAPKGVGALFVRLGVPLDPILYGDNGEGGLRPGTLNLPSIVGMGQAATLVSSDIERSAEQLERLRSVFVDELQAALGFEIDVHGSRAKRMPHILSFELPGVSGLEMQRLLPEICFSCHALHGLGRQAEIAAGKAATVAGLPVPEVTNAIRLSFGWTSNEEDVRRAAQMFAAAYESLSPGN